MKRFILLLVIVLVAYGSRDYWWDAAKEQVPASIIDSFQSLQQTIENDLSLDGIAQYFDSLLSGETRLALPNNENEQIEVDAPTLTAPDEQLFSVHNIELGDSRSDVEEETGEPMRSTENEYGVDWVTYHEEYHNFVMVGYDSEDHVIGLYSNQDLISSPTEITYGTDKNEVREQLGDPETSVRKGMFSYQVNQDEEYDLFQIDNSYVTIFYDEHRDDTVTAIQIIEYDLEQSKDELYTEPNEQLTEGFEYQLFDLTNAARVVHGLPVLTWDDNVKETARKHSTDMAENNYFGHTNLEGESPFDRMQQDDIRFITAGENLAHGQFSSIFAHEGLMNSLGHRENILQESFEQLGVGVAFNEQAQPFYTEKFFTS
ncbi:CAP domain-containing protein [Alkalicoccobacillus porphyridii]|uniref:Serine protease n=1 Tax=Alkalicoccobacillus porphyridii TaxID=2597270 RepID=A0A553ZW41_9BACI|nr:CAP domain-containing protein [Alkalicoccobacillus porphyridii]TSB45536.1 serine protease [Alkalicoccobacillus porphyridii]